MKMKQGYVAKHLIEFLKSPLVSQSYFIKVKYHNSRSNMPKSLIPSIFLVKVKPLNDGPDIVFKGREREVPSDVNDPLHSHQVSNKYSFQYGHHITSVQKQLGSL